MAEDKEQYVDRMESLLGEWRDKVDELRKKAQSAQADAKIAFSKRFERTRAGLNDFESKLNEVKLTQQHDWKSLTSGVDEAIREMRQAFMRSH